MYIIKNAIRCITRSKGRSVLIGIIALVIAVTACIGLSIKQAAESAKESTLSGMSVTATISYDRQNMMEGMTPPTSGGSGGGRFDKDQFAEMMGGASSLTLEEYLKYAEASSVQSFYYTITAYFNGGESLDPVSTDTDSDSSSSDESSTPSFPGGMGGIMGGLMGGFSQNGDFTVVGYSSDGAMTDFINGISSISSGAIFDEGTSDYLCVISQELATFNDLAVGDIISLCNPNSDEEIYELTVVGIYTSSESNNFASSMFGASQDPANKIYVSANALELILDASESVSTTVTDDSTGREYETALSSTLSATYVFADVDKYYLFEEEVRTLGLDDSYTVSSTDITAFENSLTPLNTLSTMASGFLLVVLAIGAVILVVLNIFNVRERKYEIGVLTAMGMKKWKVATQFVCEILVITMIAVFIGVGIGAVCSVPVTNALLENQVANQNSQQQQMENNFGRPGNMGGMMGSEMPDMGDSGGMFPGGQDFGGGFMDNFFGEGANYITEIDSAMNLTVVLQMIGIGLLLTLIASGVSVLFVMRYDPLKILANRD